MSELFLSTARKRESIERIAEMIGYKGTWWDRFKGLFVRKYATAELQLALNPYIKPGDLLKAYLTDDTRIYRIKRVENVLEGGAIVTVEEVGWWGRRWFSIQEKFRRVKGALFSLWTRNSW